jgi:hypothetical protein
MHITIHVFRKIKTTYEIERVLIILFAKIQIYSSDLILQVSTDW